MNSIEIEILEARIAPALIGRIVSFTDVDGDMVKITASSGSLTLDVGGIGNLRSIDATNAPHADITFKITKAQDGDGLANCAQLFATNVDLGKITIPGDLGQITCGSGSNTPAIQLLNVHSFGQLGGGMANADGTVESDIKGSIGSLKVAHDMRGAYLKITGDLGSATIGGSLVGLNTKHSGGITTTGAMGPIKIGHNVVGGNAGDAGEISSSGGIKSITIGGSLIGGGKIADGYINNNTGMFPMGPVKIGGDIIGGGGSGADGFTGTLNSFDGIASVTVRGSIIGGKGDVSGNIIVQGTIATLGPVKIGHDLTGGTGGSSGRISSVGPITSVSIGGSVTGGGLVDADGDIGLVKIGGDLSHSLATKGITSNGGHILGVAIRGSVTDSEIGAFAIGRITIGGSVNGSNLIGGNNIGPVKIGHDVSDGTILSVGGNVRNVTIGGNLDHASIVAPGGNVGDVTIGGDISGGGILAGVSLPNTTPVKIGAVKIGGDFIAGAISAGFTPGNDSLFANSDDKLVAQFGRIASIVIGGQLLGTSAASDNYGFDATSIGFFKFAHNTLGPLAAPRDITFSGDTGNDVAIHLKLS